VTTRYEVRLEPPARRALFYRLPEAVAAAVLEFLDGDFRVAPLRVGRQLNAPYAHLLAARRGSYRILYKVDEKEQVITVVDIKHRATAYRVAD
jgi:mRNA interferase RelE/StbE